MNTWLVRSVMLSLLLCTGTNLPIHAQSAIESDPLTEGTATLDMQIKQVVDKFIADEQLVGAVTLVSSKDQIIHWQAHGLADRESHREMSKDTIFRIHSFTKAITSCAAMMLWEENKFELDDPLDKYLPEFAGTKVFGDPTSSNPLRPIKIRDLLTHTSGLIYPVPEGKGLEGLYRRDTLFDIDNTLAETVHKLAELPIAFSPGEQWRYGMSIDVLGRLIEIWSGQPYEQFLQQRLFEPLEMPDTAFHVPPEKLVRLATLYEKNDSGKLEPRLGKEKGENFIPTSIPKFCMPGGGLFSTARDYHQFLSMILADGKFRDRRILQPAMVALMCANQLPENVPCIQFDKEIRDGVQFGFGFDVVTKPSKWDPMARVGELGWGGAASCHYWLWPPGELIVITLESTKPYNWNLERGLKELVYHGTDRR